MNSSRCLTQQEMAQFLAAPIAPTDALRQADLHVAACDRCREELRAQSARVMSDMESASQSSQHEEPAFGECIDSDLMLRYVRGLADTFDAENVEMHIEDCLRCRSDLESLQAFHTEFSRYAEEESPVFAPIPAEQPEPILASAAPEQPAERPNWWLKLRRRFTINTSSSAVPESGATTGAARGRIFTLNTLILPSAAGAVLAVLLLYVPLRRSLEAQMAGQWETRNRELTKERAQVEARKQEQDRQATAIEKEQQRIKGDDQQLLSQREQLAQEKQALQAREQKLVASGSAAARVETERLLADAIEWKDESGRALDSVIPAGQRGGSTPDRLIAPVETLVADDRPHFRWRSVPNAARYELKVLETVDKPTDSEHATLTRIVPGGRTREVETTLPTPLQGGKTYSWSVTATDRAGKPLNDLGDIDTSEDNARALFYVVRTEVVERIRSNKDPGQRAWLSLAAGMLDQTESELKRLPPGRARQRLEHALRARRQELHQRAINRQSQSPTSTNGAQ